VILCFKGVEAERCASFSAALKAGKPVNTPVQPTLADGSFVPATKFISFYMSEYNTLLQTVK